jgi:autotransporter-associated beta strand protein
VASLQLAVNATGTAPNGAVGSFTLGTDSTSTGVLNVTASFFLANRTNTALLTSPANGTFTINGGTANIDTDITDPSTSGDPSTRTTTLALAGGRLNMMGHAIGSASALITNVFFPDIGQTATLANLGSTGINGAGLKLSSLGTLVMDGVNTYQGATTIEHGTLLLNGSLEGTSSIALGDGLLRLGAANRIVDAATLTLTNGTFATGGFSETVGAMTLAGSIRLELGGGTSILHFADSSAPTWSGLLSVYEWSGSPAGGGTDQLYFGNSAGGLTANQLALVQFVDPFGPGSGSTSARLLPDGELVPIPEPTTTLSSLAGFGVLSLRRQRRSR